MQETTEMDIAPLSSVNAAEAARTNGTAHAQRRSAAAGFGAALDKALTKPEPFRRDSGVREPARNGEPERDDDEDRIAAAQQSAWQAARETRAFRPQPRTAADRFERAAEERRIDATDKRNESARESGSTPPAAAAAVAMARRIEAARERADDETRAVEKAPTADAAAEHAAMKSAGTAAAEAAAGTVHDAERSLDTLAPEFRGRLERVIARMEAEGHEVAVTETQRGAERQNHLYEQGRTRPGPVVTWTRNSNHMHGMAADLVIDGSYDNPAGYARLARIAAEEGLQTLGARDAGHVELSGAKPLVRTPAAFASGEIPQKIGPLYAPAGTFGAAQVAAVAEVATVAPVSGVAGVAQVAAVAQVAQPGSYVPVAEPGSAPPIARPIPAEGARTSAAETTPGTQQLAATVEAVQSEARRPHDGSVATQALGAAREAARSLAARAVASLGGKAAKDGDGAGDAGAGSQPQPQPAATDQATAAAASPFAFGSPAPARTDGVEAPLRADVAGRLERVQALQDAAAAQPLSHVTLRVEGEDGSAARINIGLRGNTVGATIDTADPLAVASMRAHVAELRQALERQGLDPSSLLVRASPRLDGADAGKLAAALTSADALASLATAAGRESSQREQSGSHNPQHGATRRDPDAQRRRQNRNGKEDRP